MIDDAQGELILYYRNNILLANLNKTQDTAFHQRNKEAKRESDLTGTVLGNIAHPTYLGVILDRSPIYNTHATRK